MTSAAMAEVAMGDAVARQGTTMPGEPPPGMVLVAAVATHKADGVRYFPGQQYYLEESRAREGAKRNVVYVLGSTAVDWWTMPGRILSPWPRDTRDGEDVFNRQQQHGALKIMQGVGYDPGSQCYRFHSAINQGTKHASILARWADSNPYSSLRQLDGEADAPAVRQAILEADVLHCHINYLMLNNSGLAPQEGQLLIRHYHGSIPPDKRGALGRSWIDPKWDFAKGAHLVGARLTLLQEAEEVAQRVGFPVPMDWLPITVPVARYRKLSTTRPVRGTRKKSRLGNEPQTPDEGFRIAHCPTKRSNKGTNVFLDVVDKLNAKGLKIVPVLMETLPQAEALERKRSCDAVFDSFWLGIQTSGLEAGTMQQPCIAGDPDVAAFYRQHIGHVPYTYANDAAQLETQIEALATDRTYYDTEAARCAAYVEQYHDYPAVARIYEGILARLLNRPDVLTET